jgi:hypothetical protein
MSTYASSGEPQLPFAALQAEDGPHRGSMVLEVAPEAFTLGSDGSQRWGGDWPESLGLV